jgi:cardiolipin synthase
LVTAPDRIVVTGLAWLGAGVGSIESALEQIFRECSDELAISAYAIGQGHDLVFRGLDGVLTRGVLVRMVVNRFDEQPGEPGIALVTLAQQYQHFHLYNFVADPDEDLHAKMVVADRRLALIGSSNLSRRGMITNHELGIVVHGSPAATAARAFDQLLRSPKVVRLP